MSPNDEPSHSGNDLLAAFYRDEFPLFVAIPTGKDLVTATINDFTTRKRKEGLAIVCWREMESAAGFVKNQLHGEKLLKIVKIMGSDLSALCARSQLDRDDVMFELL